MNVGMNRRVRTVLLAGLLWPALSSCSLLFSFDGMPEGAEPGDILGRTIKQNPDGIVPGALIDVRGARPTSSDADGDFHIRGLAAGAWQLGFVQDVERDGIAERTASRFVLLSVEPHLEGLTAQERLTYEVLGDVVMAGPGVISGTVVEEDGTLVEGARVYAVHQVVDSVNDLEYASAVLDSAITDVRGRYYLLDVPAGDVQIFAVLEEDEDTRRASELLPKFADPENPESEVELALDPTPLGEDEVQIVLTPPDLADGNAFDVFTVRAGTPLPDGALPLLEQAAVDEDRRLALTVPVGVPLDVYLAADEGTPRGLLPSAIALPVDDQPLWGPVLLQPATLACFRLPGEASRVEGLEEAANDCDADTFRGLPGLGPDRLSPFVSFDLEALWEDCAGDCQGGGTDATCDAERADGTRVTFACEAVDAAHAWEACYVQCVDASAPATCEVEGFDGARYTFDCDDDGDGQVDATENPACVGIGLGGDRDGDGLCDAVDPYPYCPGTVEDPGPCPGCTPLTEDGVCAGQYVPPPPGGGIDAGARPDAGGPDAGLDAGGPDGGLDGGVLDGGLDANDLDAGADAGLDAGVDAGVDAGPVFDLDDYPLAPAGAAAGDTHTCAISNAGPLWCFGNNTAGELGTDTVGATNQAPGAVDASGALDGAAVVETSGGVGFTCVRADTTPASVHCVGQNAAGQLGPAGPPGNSPAFVPVALTGVPTKISSGASHTCALTDDGFVECWGDNSRGQLGSAGGQPVRIDPESTTGTTGAVFVDVAAGGASTCAVTADPAGTFALYCWGAGDAGQLGDGNSTDAPGPVLVAAGGVELVRPALGAQHACALDAATGDGYCWGADAAGQLGRSGSANATNVPFIVDAAPAPFVQFALGDAFTCARYADGVVRCFGDNAQGQLGADAAPGGTDPVVVPGLLPNPQGLTAGARHACARYGGGRLFCWGDNAAGQLGLDAAQDPPGPVEVPLARIASWLGTNGTDFSDPGNWDLGVVPGADDFVIFDLNAQQGCDLDTAPAAPPGERQVLGLHIRDDFAHTVTGAAAFYFGTQLFDDAGGLDHPGPLFGQVGAPATDVVLDGGSAFGNLEVVTTDCTVVLAGAGGVVNIACAGSNRIVDVPTGTFSAVNVTGGELVMNAGAATSTMTVGAATVADIEGTVLLDLVIEAGGDAVVLPGASVANVSVLATSAQPAVFAVEASTVGTVSAQGQANVSFVSGGGAAGFVSSGAAGLLDLENASLNSCASCALGDVTLEGTFTATLAGPVTGNLLVLGAGTVVGDAAATVGNSVTGNTTVANSARLTVGNAGALGGDLSGFNVVDVVHNGTMGFANLTSTDTPNTWSGSGTADNLEFHGPANVVFAASAQAADVTVQANGGSSSVVIEGGAVLDNVLAEGDVTIDNSGTVGAGPGEGVALQGTGPGYPQLTHRTGASIARLQIGTGTTATLESGSSITEALALVPLASGPDATLSVQGPTVPQLEVPNLFTPAQVVLTTDLTVQNIVVGVGTSSGTTTLDAVSPHTVTITGTITRQDASLLRFGPNLNVELGAAVNDIDGLEFVSQLGLNGGTIDPTQGNIEGPVVVHADTTLSGALFLFSDGPGGAAPAFIVEAGATLDTSGNDVFASDPDGACVVSGTLDGGTSGSVFCHTLSVPAGGVVTDVTNVSVSGPNLTVGGALTTTGNVDAGFGGSPIPTCSVSGTWTLNGGQGACATLGLSGTVDNNGATLLVDTVNQTGTGSSLEVSGAAGFLDVGTSYGAGAGAFLVDTGASAAANAALLSCDVTLNNGALSLTSSASLNGDLTVENGAAMTAAGLTLGGSGAGLIADTSSLAVAGTLQTGSSHVLTVSGAGAGPHLSFDNIELVDSSTIDLNVGVIAQNAGVGTAFVRDDAVLQLDGGTLLIQDALAADTGIGSNPSIHLDGATLSAQSWRIAAGTSTMSAGTANLDYLDVDTGGTLQHSGGAILAPLSTTGVLGTYTMTGPAASLSAGGIIIDGLLTQSDGAILSTGGLAHVTPLATVGTPNLQISGGTFDADGIAIDGGSGAVFTGGAVTVADGFGLSVNNATVNVSGAVIQAERLSMGPSSGTFIATAGSVTADAVVVDAGTFAVSGPTVFTVNGPDAIFDFVSIALGASMTLGGATHTINVGSPTALSVGGTLQHSAGTLSVNGDTVVQPGGALNHVATAQPNYGTALYVDGTFTQAFGAVSVAGPLGVSGLFNGAPTQTVGADELAVYSGATFNAPGTLNLAHHLYVDGTFNHQNGEVVLQASGGALPCSANADFCIDQLNNTTFYDLTVNAPGRCVEFSGFSSFIDFSVDGLLTFRGSGVSPLQLDSDCSTTTSLGQWTVAADGTRDIDFVSVQDSNNVSATYIDPANFTDLGGNLRWGPEPPPCGDAYLDPGEECDDGNLFAGDGCNAACLLEPTGAGAVLVWNGNLSTNWNDEGNWEDDIGQPVGAPPGLNDLAVIPNPAAGNDPVINSFTSSFGGLKIEPTFGGTLRVDGQPVTIAGGFYGESGAVQVINGATLEVTGSFGHPGTFVQTDTASLLRLAGHTTLTAAQFDSATTVVELRPEGSATYDFAGAVPDTLQLGAGLSGGTGTLYNDLSAGAVLVESYGTASTSFQAATGQTIHITAGGDFGSVGGDGCTAPFTLGLGADVLLEVNGNFTSAACLNISEVVTLTGAGTIDHSAGGDLFGGLRVTGTSFVLSGAFGSAGVIGEFTVDGATVVSPVSDPFGNEATVMDALTLIGGSLDFGRRDVHVQFDLVQSGGTFDAAYLVRASNIQIQQGTFHAPPELRVGQDLYVAPSSFATFEHHCGDILIDNFQPAPFITMAVNDHPVYDMTLDGGQTVALDPNSPLTVLNQFQALGAGLTLQSTSPGSTVLVDARTPAINVGTATDIGPAGLGYLGHESSGTAAANFEIPATCPNSSLDGQEECDSGGGPGCSAGCTEELGYTCTGDPSVCAPNLPGNNNLITEPGEDCDDGDANGAVDGCENGAEFTGYLCFGCGKGRCFLGG